MRSDMAKVIVERPRKGGHGRLINLDKRLPVDLWHKREGIQRRHSVRKWLNENLKPLKRFLESKVGQYWPKVYQEICENINMNSAVQYHIRQHLPDFVCMNAWFEDGELTGTNPWGGIGPTWQRLYVHPKSRVLQRTPDPMKLFRTRRRQRIVRPEPLWCTDNRRTYEIIRGVWYELRFEPLPHSNETAMVRDARFGLIRVEQLARAKWYPKGVFAAMKLQLSKRDIRKLPQKQRALVESRHVNGEYEQAVADMIESAAKHNWYRR